MTLILVKERKQSYIHIKEKIYSGHTSKRLDRKALNIKIALLSKKDCYYRHDFKGEKVHTCCVYKYCTCNCL